MGEHDAREGFEADGWREPPRWPKVVGIISIVWGAIGLVCNGIGLVGGLLTPTLMQSAASQMEGGVPPQYQQVNPLMVGVSVLGAIMAVVLIVAGILTVNRKPAGRMAHLVVALVSLLVLIAYIPVQWSMNEGIAQWVRENPDAQFSQTYSPGPAIIGMAFGVVIGAAWPVFSLIWFGALKKRPEQDAPEVL